jgi:hypothetical protein
VKAYEAINLCCLGQAQEALADLELQVLCGRFRIKVEILQNVM